MNPTIHFKWLFLCVFLVSCSTVKKFVINYKLREARDTKSEKVTYSPPPLPFKKQDNKLLDAFWWNDKTKNSISYFSSCPKSGLHTSLKEIERGVLSEVGHYKIIKTVEKKNTRHTQVQVSTSEGNIQNSIYMIKATRCFYILNFVASSLKNFKKDKPVFKRFISSFKGL